MNQDVCMVYPPRNIRSPHNYEQTLSDEFNLGVFISYTKTQEWGTSNFGPIYQLCSNFADGNRFQRTLYSMWRPPKEYETIVSSRYIGKEVTIRPHQQHIHLAHGVHRGAFGLPPRTNFSDNRLKEYVQKMNRLMLRRRERKLLSDVDILIVNSEFTAEMMKKYHGMDPDRIIYPPIPTDQYFTNRNDSNSFYLYLGRLDYIKRVEEIVRGFNALDLNLVVAGDGNLRERLENISDDNIEILGFVSEGKKVELLSECSGFIQNTIVEDFGMTTVEALASGAPVIAVDDGNNPNLIQDSVNGVLFNRPGDTDIFQTSDSAEKLREAIERAESINWNHTKIQDTAEDYDINQFRQKWKEVLD